MSTDAKPTNHIVSIESYDMVTRHTFRDYVRRDQDGSLLISYPRQDGPGPTYYLAYLVEVWQEDGLMDVQARRVKGSRRVIARDEHDRIQQLPEVWSLEVQM